MTENREQDSGDELPAEMRAKLRSLYAPPSAFDARRDAAILGAVRETRRPGARHRWLLRAAIAASIAIAAGTLWMLEMPAAPPVYARTGDIRDAFYLQRQLNAHAATSPDWDENHDGVVDTSDVQALAMAAVKLDRAEGGAR